VRGNFTLQVEARKAEPNCEKCQTELPIADIAVGAEGNIHCTRCRDGASTSPAQEWLRKRVASGRQYYSCEPGADGIAPIESPKCIKHNGLSPQR